MPAQESTPVSAREGGSDLDKNDLLFLSILAFSTTLLASLPSLLAAPLLPDALAMTLMISFPILCALIITHISVSGRLSESAAWKGALFSTTIGSVLPVSVITLWCLGLAAG